MNSERLNGIWNSEYYYHDDVPSYHVLDATVWGGKLHMKSQPQDDGSHLELVLDIGEDHTLTGRWHESTSPQGDYAGRPFHGAIQLLLNTTIDRAEGRWVGHNSNYTKVSSGIWILNKEPYEV